jgi:hypothetical protein
MKEGFFLFALTGIFFSFGSACADVPVSIIINKNIVWTASGSPYIVTRNILFPQGVTPSVAPGGTVLFAPIPAPHSTFHLLIEGTLDNERAESESFTISGQYAAEECGHLLSGNASTDCL